MPRRALCWLASLAIGASGCAIFGPGADDDGESDSGGGSQDSFASGGTVPSSQPSTPTWSCYESAGLGNCECSTGFGVSERCELDWPCCIRRSESECVCTTSTSCAAEAASMPGATVVPACPPGAENIPRACAAEGVNCTGEYLTSEDLHGCCDGLACKLNSAQVWTCAAATAEEEALNWQCWDPLLPLSISGPLASSAGPLVFEHAEFTTLSRNAQGCITELWLDLQVSEQDTSCSMDIMAGPAADDQGRLLITSARLFANDCPTLPLTGYPSSDGALGTVAFEGFACEHCSAGTLKFELSGTLSFPLDPNMLTFDRTQFEITGRMCGTSTVTAPCPGAP